MRYGVPTLEVASKRLLHGDVMAVVFLGWDPGLRLAWCLFLTFFAFSAVVRNYAGRMLGRDNPGIGGFGDRTGIEQVQICRLGRKMQT